MASSWAAFGDDPAPLPRSPDRSAAEDALAGIIGGGRVSAALATRRRGSAGS